MPENNDFDFFEEFTVSEQNDFLRTYLIETTKYLRPIPFPNSPGYFYYENVFIDNDYHGNSITNLAVLLNLLVSRDFLWPLRLKIGNPAHSDIGELPYFGFTSDFKFLDDADDEFFDFIQKNEIKNMAKVLQN